MAEAETLTAQGDVPGTLAYISPERLAGGESVAAADVWAIGVMLWESLAGRHPFWHTSMLDTARAIEEGAPSLAVLRPDLPKGLIQLVDRALTLDPARRPTAADLAAGLRGAYAERQRKQKTKGPRLPTATSLAVPHVERVAAPLLAAAFAAFATAQLPFFPHGAAGRARNRRGARDRRPATARPRGRARDADPAARQRLARARAPLDGGRRRLARPLLAGAGVGPPLRARAGARADRRARPAAARDARRPRARAPGGARAAGVLAAFLAAGLRHTGLPLVGGRPPLAIGVAGATDPLDVFGSIIRALGAQPALLVEAAALAAVAVALPFAPPAGAGARPLSAPGCWCSRFRPFRPRMRCRSPSPPG